MECRNERIGLLWFTQNLRIHDNPCIIKAVELLISGEIKSCIPVYFWDLERFDSLNHHGKLSPDKAGIYQRKFLIECLIDLRQSLEDLGSHLVIMEGKALFCIKTLLPKGGLIICHEDSEQERDESLKEVKQAGYELLSLWGSTMYHVDDTPFKRNYDQLQSPATAFMKSCKDIRVRCPLRTADKGCLNFPEEPLYLNYINIIPSMGVASCEDSRRVLTFKGGESHGLERVDYYLKSGLIDSYKSTRNGMLGGDFSTKLSPWLARGCISPRMLYHSIRKHERATGGGTEGSEHLIFELKFRDYFHYFQKKHGDHLYRLAGPVPRRSAQWIVDDVAMTRWMEGRTGWPFIDANMRELLSTGYMSNRGRQVVASFLVWNLELDWRLGARHFERLLIDYDVAINWGNWASLAGLVGGRLNIFNTVKQAHEYDPDGDYVKVWVPELKPCPKLYINEPFQWPGFSKSDYEKFKLPNRRGSRSNIYASQDKAKRNSRERKWSQDNGGNLTMNDFMKPAEK